MKKLLYYAVTLALLFASFALLAQMPMPSPAPAAAEQTFASMKTLAGSWQGRVSTTPSTPEADGKIVSVSLRTTSTGNAVLHEMTLAGRPDDPITMIYPDGGALLLTHYCDAGNRPHMRASVSPDGRVIDFSFVGLDGGNQFGHMHHVRFTLVDASHHTEDWTYMGPGDHPVVAHFDLARTTQLPQTPSR